MPKLSVLMARNFQRIRRAVGGTQEEFAEASGLSQSAISRLENREGWKHLDKISEGIARAGGDPTDLLDASGEAADKRITRIRRLISRADPATIDIVLALLERNVPEEG